MPGELAAPYRPPCYYNGTWPDSSRRNILLGGCQQHWRESEQNITRWRNNMPETPAEQTTCEGGTLIDHNCYKEVTQGATATAELTDGKVTAITLDDPNTYNRDYTFVPTVTISGGGGTGATAHAVLTGDAVTSIEVDTQGSGYTSVPDVSVSIPKWNLALCDKSMRWKAVTASEWTYGNPDLHSMYYGGGPYQLQATVSEVDGLVLLSFGATLRDCSNSTSVNDDLYRKCVATVIRSEEQTGRYSTPYGKATVVRAMQINDAGVCSTPTGGDSDTLEGDEGTAAAMATVCNSILFDARGDCVDKCYMMSEQQMMGVFFYQALANTVGNYYSGYSMTSGPDNDQVFSRGDTIEVVGTTGGAKEDMVDGGRIEITYRIGYTLDYTWETWAFFDGVQTSGRTEVVACVCSADEATYSSEISQFWPLDNTLSSSASVTYKLSNKVTPDADLKTLLAEWDMSNDIIYPWVETGYGDHPHVYRDAYQSSRGAWPSRYNTPFDAEAPTSYFDNVPYSEDGQPWEWNAETSEWAGGPHPAGDIKGKPALVSGGLVDRHYWFEAPNGTSTPGAWNTSITGLPRTATRWLAFDPTNCTGAQYCAAGAHSEHQVGGLRYMQKMVWSIPTLPSLNYFGPCGEMRTWQVGEYDSETQTWSCSETLRFPDAWAICGRLKVVSIDGDTKTVTLSEPATYLVSGDTIDFTTYDTSFVETVTAEEYTVDTVAVDKLSFTYTDEITPEGDYIKDHGAPHYKWYDTNPKGDFIKCEVTHHGAGDSTTTSCVGACIRNASCTPMIIGYSPNTDVEQWPDNARVYDLTSCDADTICGAYWTGVTYGGMTDPFHPQDPDTCEPIAQSVEAQCLAPTGATVPADKSAPPVPYITLGCAGPVELSTALNPPEGAWV